MSKWRQPHGQYVRTTPDWFIDNHMFGGSASFAAVGKFSSVSLYNDATDGSTLHVYGLLSFTTTAATVIQVIVTLGTYGPAPQGVTQNVVPYRGLLAGSIYVNQVVDQNQNNTPWAFPTMNSAAPWPYDFPVAILPPGYSLVCEGQKIDADVWAYFHWLVMGKNEGYL
jgi:hypothetical protein